MTDIYIGGPHREDCVCFQCRATRQANERVAKRMAEALLHPRPYQGHGIVIPNKDGSRARCGGPPGCLDCNRELASLWCPTPELKGKKPLVLYFLTDTDREEFVAIIQAVKPGMVTRKL